MEKPFSNQHRLRDSGPVNQISTAASIAAAYNQAGGDYVAYADGDPARLYDFNGLHAHATGSSGRSWMQN